MWYDLNHSQEPISDVTISTTNQIKVKADKELAISLPVSVRQNIWVILRNHTKSYNVGFNFVCLFMLDKFYNNSV